MIPEFECGIKDEHLLAKTQAYWQLSLSYSGYGKPIAVGKAFEKINKVLAVTNPSRPLVRFITQLEGEIISGHSLKQTTKAPLVQLHKVAATANS